MPTLTLLGAAQTVTGSRHLLTSGSGKRILARFAGRGEAPAIGATVAP